jgi:phosphopantothenoylcysteine decarboxylase/phosphopantothenate--cysteine ligase
MARLLIGVSGGIAAYKALEVVRLAVKAGHQVRVVQTPASLQFVGRASFAGITGAPVLVDEFEPDPASGAYPGDPPPQRAPISHLALVERADAYLIAPASANTLAKLAGGQADSILTAAALAAACPVAVAPAMNHRMYHHAATQENLQTLRRRGVTVIEPGEGSLASHGEWGVGRLAEPPLLLEAWEALARGVGAQRRPWAGARVLVTAGGTREPLDSVRFLGNRSSGRMGVALAAAAAARGAEVTLVAAHLAVAPPAGVRTVEVGTAAELGEACRREFPSCDLLLMAAAVADFRPAHPAAHKLKKDAGPPPPIELAATEDVLAGLGATRRPGQVLIGFAAEHGDGALEHARGKLARKHLDAVVLNDVSQPGIGFDARENEVTIVTAAGEQRVPRAEKSRIAEAVLDAAGRLREQGAAAARGGREGGSDGAVAVGRAGVA